jgi:hypothetical protein
MDIGTVLVGVMAVFAFLAITEVLTQQAHEGGGWWHGVAKPALAFVGLVGFVVVLGAAVVLAARR